MKKVKYFKIHIYIHRLENVKKKVNKETSSDSFFYKSKNNIQAERKKKNKTFFFNFGTNDKTSFKSFCVCAFFSDPKIVESNCSNLHFNILFKKIK